MLADSHQQSSTAHLAPMPSWMSGLRGFWPVLGGHLEHARLANRIDLLAAAVEPDLAAQNDPELRVVMKYPG
jgi:hypothetical protein